MTAGGEAGNPGSGWSGLRRLPEAQEGIWYAQQLDPANPSFNTAEYHDLRGPLDREAFIAAAAAAMGEADGLAVRVIAGGDGPLVEPAPEHAPAIIFVDCTGAGDPAAEARRIALADLRRPVDPGRDPLAAGILLRLGPEHHWWYQRIHHLVIDGYGTVLLNDRIVELYNAAVAGTPSGAPLDGYRLALESDMQYRAGDRRRIDRDFWLASHGGGMAPLPLAGAGPVSGIPHRAAVCWQGDGPAALLEAAAGIGIGWPDLLTLLVAEFLRRRSGEAEIVAGLPSMQRMGTGVARVATMAMNVIPFRFAPDGHRPLPEVAREMAASLRTARRHGRYRGEQLRRDLGWSGNGRRLYGPLVNVLPFGEERRFAGIESARHLLNAGPVDDLTVTIRGAIDGTEMSIEVEADPRLHDRPEAMILADRLVSFLDRAAGAATLAEVRTLSPGEERRWIEEVNRTAHPVPDVTLVDLLDRTMALHGDAVALIDPRGTTLTWSQVGEKVAGLAEALAGAGVRKGDPVVVALPRSIDQVLVIYAIVRAGGAWMPVDADHPAARLAAMIEGAGAAVVVTADSWRERFRGCGTVLVMEELRDACNIGEPAAPDPASTAYLIHTSGSTGDPKGVQVSHRAIVNRLLWMADALAVETGDRILLKTPATFDVSVWEFWLPAVTGSALVVSPPESHRDPAAIAALVRDHGITLIHFVPSMLDAFLAEPAACGLSMPKVVVSGEALAAGLRDRFHRICTGELVNLYGPTEAAVDVTIWRAGRNDRSDPVPIGRPVWNTRVYVLDELLRPVAPGTPGDLWLAGVQLADGYRGSPERTAAAFVPDPFGAPGERMYRTGDRATWRNDGELIFLGRDDGQVKLRGQRIETGEIASALLALPGVAQAAVLLREDRPGDQRLVAYLVPAAGGTVPGDAELRRMLSLVLPPALVPAAFVALDRLPVSSHGKLDRSRLPAPALLQLASDGEALRGTETAVAAAYAEILGLPDATAVSRDTDFFGAGGHSLLAVRLVRLLGERLGLRIGIGAVFANPVISRLAGHLDSLRGAVEGTGGWEGLGPTIVLAEGPPGGAAPPLFCIHPAGGLSWCYREFGSALGDRRPVIGIQSRGIGPGDRPAASLAELAADYCATIRSIQPEGPYHLLGWSIGGLIAHEMAVFLEAAGESVATLAMLDSFPADRWHSAAEPDEAEALRALVLVAGFAPDEIRRGEVRSREEVMAFLRERGHPLGTLPDEALDGIFRTVLHNNRLVRKHRHRRCLSDVTYFSAALDHLDDGFSPDEWLPYVGGGFRVVPIESRHPHMTRPAQAARIAGLLDAEWLVEQG